jgi:hypothetical protein
MHRLVVCVSVVVVLLVGGIATLGIGRGATAQEATPRAMAEHPIVGAWQWDTDPDNPGTHISYGVFHADGTYVVMYPNGGGPSASGSQQVSAPQT